MELTPVMQKFILHWGEMGARWGVNRTVAQIHALLYLSPEPLTAEEISQTLQVARSNVSTSLRELQGWGIVRGLHVLGSRRERFESMRDVWEMFQVVMDERKKREIDPTLALLRECVAEAEASAGGKSKKTKADAKPTPDDQTQQRLTDMLDFFETVDKWYEQFRHLPTRAVIRFAKLPGQMRKFLGVA